jgi:hypothetical protein
VSDKSFHSCWIDLKHPEFDPLGVDLESIYGSNERGINLVCMCVCSFPSLDTLSLGVVRYATLLCVLTYEKRFLLGRRLVAGSTSSYYGTSLNRLYKHLSTTTTFSGSRNIRVVVADTTGEGEESTGVAQNFRLCRK